MASLSDQIDRLSRNTRAISEAAATIAPSTASTAFTRAVLSTHLGDLIRDIDPSELGLFRIIPASTSNTYDGSVRTAQDHHVRRVDFSTATPLRKSAVRGGDKQEIEPEVYAHAALKYIDRYEPIRPMPRAYDQIVTILTRLNAVRGNISALSKALEQITQPDKEPPTKTRIAEEERRIKDLQARIAELSKLKEQSASKPAPAPTAKPAPRGPLKPPPPKPPISPGSPQEDKFWATKGEPSRTLRFSENLLDEEVNLGDVSSTSFGTPLAQVSRLKIFGEVDEPSIVHFPSRDTISSLSDDTVSPVISRKAAPAPPVPETPPPAPQAAAQTPPPRAPPTETPTARQRKVKVNIELDRIVAKIWATSRDIVAPHLSSPLPVPETITYLQELADQTPAPDSPAMSSASSAVVEGGGAPKPNTLQIQYAHLLTLLLSEEPHYSMPHNEVKEHLAAKAKAVGGSSRVLFQGIANRLVKIDRKGREQTVKFDI